jgi:glycosyl hydrolase family 141/parallel beta helix pectate lyase-like protein
MKKFIVASVALALAQGCAHDPAEGLAERLIKETYKPVQQVQVVKRFRELTPEELKANEFYIAPTGNDENPGTLAEPFGTLERTKDAVAQKVAAGLNSNLIIFLRGGTYELEEPLILGPKTSGTDQYSVSWIAQPGETPVISGGRRINGWTKGEGNIWTTEIPEVRDGKAYFRNFWVNDQRAIRARSPNADAPEPFYRLREVYLSPDQRDYLVTLGNNEVQPWKKVIEVELVTLGDWEITDYRLEKIDPTNGIVRLPTFPVLADGYIRPRPGLACYFENAIEMLDEPGEWHLDRKTGVLSYWPRPGEDMAAVETVAPRLTLLLRISGTAHNLVKNVHFHGIHFEHTDSILPATGYVGWGACATLIDRQLPPDGRRMPVEVAINLDFSKSCSVEDCQVTHLGASGCRLGEGSAACSLRGNEIFDVGAHGIVVFGRSNQVVNNHIHQYGRVYYAGSGVLAPTATDALIAHNWIHDGSYNGISIGEKDESLPAGIPSVCNTTIAYNRIENVMTRLSDGGGIYTLGSRRGLVLQGNLVFDVRRTPSGSGAPNNGIFFDERSIGVRVEDNIIYDTAGDPVRFNMCERGQQNWGKNCFGIRPGETNFPSALAAQAGIEPHPVESQNP